MTAKCIDVSPFSRATHRELNIIKICRDLNISGGNATCLKLALKTEISGFQKFFKGRL